MKLRNLAVFCAVLGLGIASNALADDMVAGASDANTTVTAPAAPTANATMPAPEVKKAVKKHHKKKHHRKHVKKCVTETTDEVPMQ